MLAHYLSKDPTDMLKLFDEMSTCLVLKIYKDYWKVKSETHVRITNYPTLNTISDLKTKDIGKLVRVSGVVTQITRLLNQISSICYDCVKCGGVLGPFIQFSNIKISLENCNLINYRSALFN